MLNLNTLKVTKGSRKRRKVVGRGLGTGHGTYSGRGAKGQKARKSGPVRPGFEGGRQPLIRQLPKLRGFKSHHAKSYALSLSKLNAFSDGDIVTIESLRTKGIVSANIPVKLLASGNLKKKLTVKLPMSVAAKTAVEKAGGKVE